MIVAAIMIAHEQKCINHKVIKMIQQQLLQPYYYRFNINNNNIQLIKLLLLLQLLAIMVVIVIAIRL